MAAAARIADLPLARFLEILSSLKIPVATADAGELAIELSLARRWLGNQ